MKLVRWRTDFGNGRMGWFLTHRSHGRHRDVPLTVALRHPIRAWRWIIQGKSA